VKNKLDNSALELSIGQQQRLCTARVIALQPEVFLLDEVTSSLDPISTKKIEQLISILGKEKPIIMVTHSLQQAISLSDQVIFMMDGRIIEYGKTKEIFINPKNEKTEAYITGRFQKAVNNNE
jgi:phosphate transport system ATP-binding protein